MVWATKEAEPDALDPVDLHLPHSKAVVGDVAMKATPEMICSLALVVIANDLRELLELAKKEEVAA